ncbi:MAG: penicillin-binding protein 2 [candidate division WOR-3 bacterium]
MEHRFARLTQVLAVLFAILIVRLTQLQLVQGRRYSYLSDRNRIRQVVRPAPRGRILDRNGRVIAESRPSFTCTVVPTELGDTTLGLLARLLDVPEEELSRRIRPVAAYASPVKVKRDLSLAEVCRIEENSFRLSGVHLRIDPVRSYPSGEAYGHVLGHLGEASDDDLRRDTTLRPLDLVGRSGIEAEYERLLRGRDGYEYVEVDVRGQEVRPLPEKRPVPPVPGKELHLTLDDRIQQLAAELTNGYDRAAVVGLKVRTGEVVCLFSRPTFNPGVFIGSVDTAVWNRLMKNRSKPFFNRAISSGYPPGSTMKPVVALAALRRGVISPSTVLDPCHGSYRYGNRTFKCWSSHGAVNLVEALAVSCNNYFYQVGLRLGIDSLTAFALQVGLGRNTGIDLPGERAGNIPTRAWLDRRYGKGRWGAGSILNFAIGQGEVLVTPLQLAVFYAAVANNGVACRPYLLDHADSAGHEVYRAQVRTTRLPVSEADIRVVKAGLDKVVEYGTAAAVRMKEVAIAGKTGTAQNPPRPDHAWFVGYAPADDPEVVFSVLVENAGHGGSVAAPIAARLIRAWFFPDEATVSQSDSADQ